MVFRLFIVLAASISAANLIAFDEHETLANIDLVWGAAFAAAFPLLWLLTKGLQRF
ncbi:hypothetical protein [Hyphomicrobium sp. CS1GBMeth3]|uniref:hypothetical protein n=1 Tax=Hyphomicrobium sp. CS1GBMeth3 TaxID=1892845 RepID=UPI000A9FCE60|nr:hypothetical protein [Hyphomicrobium sp. CS1GBMeth3]